MAKGYFWVAQDQGDPKDIHFKQIELASGETVPDDQLELKDRIESALTTIRSLFDTNEQHFARYFRPLLSLAQLGLVGNSANPAVATRALTALKNEMWFGRAAPLKTAT
jgi:hypothetical protein